MAGQERSGSSSGSKTDAKSGTKPSLPDVAFENEDYFLPLAWVGMNEIEIPLHVKVQDQSFVVPARAEVKVRLQSGNRGIHMSRLFVGLQDVLAQNQVSTPALQVLTENLLESQKDLSHEVYVALKFEMPILRPSLLSQNKGWRTYPVAISAIRGPKGYREFMEVSVTYSSTCPASAALSRQINSQMFTETFKDKTVDQEKVAAWLLTQAGMPATPHAQRSVARVRIEKDPVSALDIPKLVEMIEDSLKTAVQSVVKREDEQEFARRNAQNLMFCEDAGRRVQWTLLKSEEIKDFYGEFHHLESLHPHDAVSHIQKSAHGLNSFAIPVSAL